MAAINVAYDSTEINVSSEQFLSTYNILKQISQESTTAARMKQKAEEQGFNAVFEGFEIVAGQNGQAATSSTSASDFMSAVSASSFVEYMQRTAGSFSQRSVARELFDFLKSCGSAEEFSAIAQMSSAGNALVQLRVNRTSPISIESVASTPERAIDCGELWRNIEVGRSPVEFACSIVSEGDVTIVLSDRSLVKTINFPEFVEFDTQVPNRKRFLADLSARKNNLHVYNLRSGYDTTYFGLVGENGFLEYYSNGITMAPNQSGASYVTYSIPSGTEKFETAVGLVRTGQYWHGCENGGSDGAIITFSLDGRQVAKSVVAYRQTSKIVFDISGEQELKVDLDRKGNWQCDHIGLGDPSFR